MSATIAAGRKLIIDESPLIALPTLAELIGLEEALVLQQIHYFLQRTTNIIDGFRWVYNTYEQWKEVLPFLSLRSLRRIMTKLEDMKLIRSERLEAHNWYQRKWYTICYETLETLISSIRPDCPVPCGQFDLIDPAKLDDSLTKISSIQEFKETTDTVPTLHPVFTDKQGDELVKEQAVLVKADGSLLVVSEQLENNLEGNEATNKSVQEQTEQKTLDTELREEIEEVIAPARLNPQIQRQILSVSAEVVRDAIAVVKERKVKGKVKNPAGLLSAAIKGQWKPSFVKDVSMGLDEAEKQEFNEWFELARQAGLVLASSVIDEVMCVCTKAHQWEPYLEIRAAFSSSWLRRAISQGGIIGEFT
ncbi:MAG: hypothetical protein HC790_08370 [Acaryochloridaceae cyanobacterium CSU_3_4]|nr:hypothetical protein [Acaryochloridaceae cyanobacterium CSU_3_4]